MDIDSFSIAPGALVHVVSGDPLASRPAFHLEGQVISVSGGADGPEPEPAAVWAATVGSAEWLWGVAESWRFGAVSGELRSVVFVLPGVNLAGPEHAGEWRDVPRTAGALELTPPRDFLREPAGFRWCDPQGARLFGFYDAEPTPQGAKHKVPLSADVDLLVLDGELVGWEIADPARFLAAGDAGRISGGEDATLGRQLARFLELVTDDGLDRLEDGDLELRAGLEHVDKALEELCERRDPRALVLRAEVRRILSEFAAW